MRQFWLGCILLSTVLSSTAASLGRQSGAAVIGRPLDVRVQLLLSPDEVLDSLCLSAEVSYGDVAVPGSAVLVTPQRTAPDAQVFARVQAARAVNEPFVYVNLRAGCAAAFSRQYVFLADPATDVQAAPVANQRSAQTVLPAAPAQASDLGGGDPQRSEPATPSAPAAATAPAARLRVAPAPQARPARPAAPVSAVRRPPVAPPAPPAAPRLQLDPLELDLSIERDPALKLSLSMLGQPSDSAETREAAARLWKALNASPEDVLRDQQKLSALGAEIQGLRAEEEKNKALTVELGTTAERARYLNWLVFLLAALLLLALVALAVVWRRRGEAREDQASNAWWSDASKAEIASSGVKTPPAMALKLAEHQGGLELDLDVDSGYGEPVSGARTGGTVKQTGPAPTSAVPARDKKEFASSAPGGSRSVAAEELFDIQQQADFFVSLGELDQAIQVLLNHLAESFEPSPLAYLDLFKLYHRMNRREEYDRLRTEFNELFNAGAPPFDQYSDQSRGLESYEAAFTRIQALWPEPRVLDVIEQSIFRDAGEGGGEVFDLEAYRELLLLHAIAKDLVKRDAERAPSEFRHTKVQPLTAANQVAEPDSPPSVQSDLNGRNTVPMDVLPPASPHLGLDVDLSELDAYADFEASLPDINRPVEPTAQFAAPQRQPSESAASGMIDFDVLDFSRPEEDVANPNKDGDK